MSRDPITGRWGFGPKMFDTCSVCGGHFLRPIDETWKKTCLDCYKNQNSGNFRGQTAGHQPRSNFTPPPIHRLTLELEPDELRFLLLVAHPDRHTDDATRNQTATAITRKLITLRKRN